MSGNLVLEDVDFRIVLRKLQIGDTDTVYTVREHQQRKLFTDLQTGAQNWTDWFAIPELEEEEEEEEETVILHEDPTEELILRVAEQIKNSA